MKPNNHLGTLENLCSLMAQKTDMNLPSHLSAQNNFKEIAGRLIEADEMEGLLEKVDKPDNITPLIPGNDEDSQTT